MVNRSEPLINVVRTNKPKDADRLEPKGTWSGVIDVSRSSTVDRTTTGEQAGPNPSDGTDTERGKPTCLP